MSENPVRWFEIYVQDMARAKAFYEHYGFQASPLHPMTLMLRLHTVKP